MTTDSTDVSFGVHTIQGKTERFAAIIQQDSRRIFDYEDVTPVPLKEGFRGYVPWGSDNEQPYQIIEKIRDDEVLSSNMWFNVQTGYGLGFRITNPDGSSVTDKPILQFFRRNNMVRYWAEQFSDIKHFFFSVLVVILDNEGKRIVQIRHKEAVNCRFETCNPTSGVIENLFYCSWKDPLSRNNAEVIPLLDEDDPETDLLVRLGIEPDPYTGQKRTPTTARMFAIVNRIPTPGHKYYPFPPYCSTFNSGWSDFKAMIPQAKKARMVNGMSIKYMVELHRDYFSNLFKAENITEPDKKKERKTLEITNIKNFLSGVDNQNKSWFSTYYIDPNGKEQPMVRITNVGKEAKEGGDFLEDSEESSNIVSYAMGVHPSLIGSSPGKSKTINGTEARELFTMKQALEHLTRDLILQPFYLVNAVNNWDLKYEFPDLLLTTLDKKTDAVDSSKKTPDDADNNS